MGKIKLHKQSQEQCCRVQLYESVTVPPHSVTFVKTYTSQNRLDQLNIVEPSNKQLHQGLYVAKTLVDTSQAQMVVSVLNVGSKSVKLRENTLGTIHPIEACSSNESGSLDEKGAQANVELPDHLKPLLENASPNLNEAERQRLASLILEFQDVFMSPDGKLKQTSLAEHYIDTGETRPFKVPSRRIPIFRKAAVEQEIEKMLGSFCFMSWCLKKIFVLLAPYVCFHIFN